MKGKQSRKIPTLVAGVSLMLLILMTASVAACAKPAPSSTPVTAPTSTPVKPITLVYTTWEAPVGQFQEFYHNIWFAELEKRTGGRVKVEEHWAGELAGPRDSYDAALKGTVDLAHFMPAETAGRFPMDDIVTLCPYDTLSYRPARVYWELYQEFPEMQAEYKDVKLLWVGSLFFNGYGSTAKAGPILKLEDFQGKRMNAIGSLPAAREVALGSTPVAVMPQDLYSSFQTGVLDGGNVGTMYQLRDMMWGDVIKNITMVNSARVAFGCVMNLNKWNSLPPDIQKIMNDMSGYLVDAGDELNVRTHYERMASAPKEFGTQFFNIPPEEVARWVKADKPVWDKFVADLEAKGLPGKKLVDEYLRLDKKYSAEEYNFK